MQLSLISFPLVTNDEMQDAWEWLLDTMSPRPTTPSQICIYDHKQWQDEGQFKPLKPDTVSANRLAILFLVSELGTDESIYRLANCGEVTQISVPTGGLDRDIANVIKEEKGFRDSLSEHLAFWVRLASAAQINVDGQRFACSLPNVQSRDKGPDGLFITFGHTDYVEIQSVKNTINNPRSLVATRKFREHGQIHQREKPKQLEELWLTANENWGIVRLQRTLSQLCRLLDIPAEHLFKMSLSKDLCYYNAIVIADQRHASPNVFDGYQYVLDQINRRIATYVSSEKWKELAEMTRQKILAKLRQSKLIS